MFSVLLICQAPISDAVVNISHFVADADCVHCLEKFWDCYNKEKSASSI